MMNINYITNKLSLWKDIDIFYSFDELVELSKNYYDNQVRICLASSTTIFDFNFNVTHTHIWINTLNESEQAIQIIYNGMLFDKELKSNLYFLPKYTPANKKMFTNIFKDSILNSVQDIEPIKKFCLLSELYSNILEGVNI